MGESLMERRRVREEGLRVVNLFSRDDTPPHTGLGQYLRSSIG